MQEILNTFGIDWRLLLINSINFGVVLLVLWYFLYTPVMRILEERRAKVTKGVADAEAAEAKLAEINSSRQEILGKAGGEADELLAHARQKSSEIEKEVRARGEVAAQTALHEAEAQAQELKGKALEEAKRESAKLVVLGVEKMMMQHK